MTVRKAGRAKLPLSPIFAPSPFRVSSVFDPWLIAPSRVPIYWNPPRLSEVRVSRGRSPCRFPCSFPIVTARRTKNIFIFSAKLPTVG